MFLPPPRQAPQRPSSAGPPGIDPLAGSAGPSPAGVVGGPGPYGAQSGRGGPLYHHGTPQMSEAPSGYGGPAQGYAAHPGMVQSMVLPGQHGQHPQAAYRGQGQNAGRTGTKRLDERQAAKLLAGGF